MYSKWVPGHTGGESEAILGEWMKQRGNRVRIIVATKVGMDMGDGKKAPVEVARSGFCGRLPLRRLCKRITSICTSLTLMTRTTPFEETLGAYAELDGSRAKSEPSGLPITGRERKLCGGASMRARRRDSLPIRHFNRTTASSNALNTKTILHRCAKRESLGVISYFPLAGGFLSGKYRSESDTTGKARARNVTKYLNERGHKVLDALDNVARKHRATPAKVALAWVMARPSITAPIVSATNIDQLNDLISAVDLALDRESIALLNDASA